ncbi:MAG: FMN-binding protein [bacterium]
MMRKRSFTVFLIVLLSFVMSGCTETPKIGGPLKSENLKDGVYQGSYRGGRNKAIVEVTIKGGKITEIKLLKHIAVWKGRRAESVIPGRIIENQSTNVDAVSGATNSSHVIMNAVQKAVEKASHN